MCNFDSSLDEYVGSPFVAQSASPNRLISTGVPKFCAEVLATDDFDFRGCTLPCQSLHEDCPDGMLYERGDGEVTREQRKRCCA